MVGRAGGSRDEGALAPGDAALGAIAERRAYHHPLGRPLRPRKTRISASQEATLRHRADRSALPVRLSDGPSGGWAVVHLRGQRATRFRGLLAARRHLCGGVRGRAGGLRDRRRACGRTARRPLGDLGLGPGAALRAEPGRPRRRRGRARHRRGCAHLAGRTREGHRADTCTDARADLDPTDGYGLAARARPARRACRAPVTAPGAGTGPDLGARLDPLRCMDNPSTRGPCPRLVIRPIGERAYRGDRRNLAQPARHRAGGVGELHREFGGRHCGGLCPLHDLSHRQSRRTRMGLGAAGGRSGPG